jgi:hypothetical protein
MLLRNVVSWNVINVKAKPLEQAMVLGLGYGHFLFYLCSCFQLFLTCELIHFSVRASMLS